MEAKRAWRARAGRPRPPWMARRRAAARGPRAACARARAQPPARGRTPPPARAPPGRRPRARRRPARPAPAGSVQASVPVKSRQWPMRGCEVIPRSMQRRVCPAPDGHYVGGVPFARGAARKQQERNSAHGCWAVAGSACRRTGAAAAGAASALGSVRLRASRPAGTALASARGGGSCTAGAITAAAVHACARASRPFQRPPMQTGAGQRASGVQTCMQRHKRQLWNLTTVHLPPAPAAD